MIGPSAALRAGPFGCAQGRPKGRRLFRVRTPGFPLSESGAVAAPLRWESSVMQAILVVDDDDAIREGLAEALHASGRTVITCSDVESAQVVVENEPISAVVCDVRLSGPLSIDGIDFIDHVRAQQAGSKIVVMSGSGVAEIPPEALRHGATQFLAKPFDFADLE